ncbi:acyltransferase [Chitinophagaceae bacterium 26-R-25]|nr:acyltransferase [Chitinophagaceae bacterium 26-R-25]
MNNSNNGYFPAMTGVRAIAAYLVFVYHMTSSNEVSIAYNNLSTFCSQLHIGVTVFYVLSGFVITNKYYDTQKINWRKYFINRFARIYPMFFGITTLTYLAKLIYPSLTININLPLYLLNITFLKSFFADFILSGVGQTWSLTPEEMFYFSVPLFYFFIKKSTSYLLVIPVGLLVIGLMLVAIFKNVDFYGFFNSNQLMLQTTFFGRSCEFFVGIFLALMMRKRKETNLSNWGVFTYAGMVIIIVHIVALAIVKTNYHGESGVFLYHFICNFSLPVLGISSFFWGLLTERSLVSKLLSSGLFQILGKSSYVFYLIHVGIVAVVLSKINASPFFLFIALNIVSIVLFKLAEEPSARYIKQKLYPVKIKSTRLETDKQ